MRVTLPTGMDLHDWADQVCLDLGSYGPIGKLSGDDWQGWAVQMMVNVASRNMPSPYGYENWREWAERFCGAL